MSNLSKLALAASAVASVGSANATVITTTVSLNQLLSSSSGVYTGAFAINPFLAANNLAGATVLSANISAYGYSDIQINGGRSAYDEQYLGGYTNYVISGYYTTSHRCGWFDTCYTSTPNYAPATYDSVAATRTYTNMDTITDTLTLATGTTSSSGSDSRTVTSSDSAGGSSTRNNGTYGYQTVYMTDRTVNDFTSGALGTGLLLSAADLLALARSGVLNFSVAASSGQFNLQQFAVTLDVREFAVPEPASAALMLAGLAGLAAAARGRRIKKGK